MLCKSFGMFIVLPLSTISVLYFVLLVKEENNRYENNRTLTGKVQVIVLMGSVDRFPIPT